MKFIQICYFYDCICFLTLHVEKIEILVTKTK